MLGASTDVSNIAEVDSSDTTPGIGQPVFILHGLESAIGAVGERAVLPPGPLATLGDRVAAFFARKRGVDGAPALLVGAFPFDPLADDRLYQPNRLADPLALEAARADRGTMPVRLRSMRAEPQPEQFVDAVRRALVALETGRDGPRALAKVVLARSLEIVTAKPIDPLALFGRLAGDPGVTRFMTPLPPQAGVARHLVGATPEPLISKRGKNILSFPLAGSLPRAIAGAERALMASDKDRREHALVVEAIADILAPYCATLSVPSAPELRATRTMWHLGSRISGALKGDDLVSSAALAALLHPTPAVGGTPRDRAIDLIREIEPVARGFYAGAVGWTDAQGDGDWHVSLRCAEISGARARVHAGAGIVPGSDPLAEVAETSAKFRAMLDAFGIDEGDATVGNTAA